ncbi:TIGR04197 family type VII secretion effector [Neobacillus soli]|uniref:TIGR04197 family type VII secretion effector n=1 Tax=Neobacillus soli TaxID=220688 RepID=UPI000824AC82|nr:TIGR04197 family type VII secretion effector [Neobacillus soli]
MSGEIGINIDLFRTNVEKLKSSLTGLQMDSSKNRSFNQTNIDPFKEDLQNVIKTIQLLEKYKALLGTDIYTLQKTGESIRENDEHVAKMLHMHPQQIY